MAVNVRVVIPTYLQPHFTSLAAGRTQVRRRPRGDTRRPDRPSASRTSAVAESGTQGKACGYRPLFLRVAEVVHGRRKAGERGRRTADDGRRTTDDRGPKTEDWESSLYPSPVLGLRSPLTPSVIPRPRRGQGITLTRPDWVAARVMAADGGGPVSPNTNPASRGSRVFAPCILDRRVGSGTMFSEVGRGSRRPDSSLYGHSRRPGHCGSWPQDRRSCRRHQGRRLSPAWR